jgi:hypothetical protein
MLRDGSALFPHANPDSREGHTTVEARVRLELESVQHGVVKYLSE